MKVKTSAVLFLIAVVQVEAAVTFTNLIAEQREGSKLVDITFDAFNDSGSSLGVSVILSNGTSQISASSFSGDIGGEVSEGSGLQMVWDGGVDLPDVMTSNLTITLQVSDSTSSDMVLIPAGMNVGSDPDFGSYALSVDSILVDDTEVTSGEWQEVYDWALNNGYAFFNVGSALSDLHPVVNIDWFDCALWCNARSEMDGLLPAYLLSNGSVARTTASAPFGTFDASKYGYRLLTDEEYEYAARGGLIGERFPWGDTISHDEANYLADNRYSYDVSDQEGYHPDYNEASNPVYDFSPNGLGLYGVGGNVWEWCWSGSGSSQSQRSGGFADDASQARCGHHDTLAKTVNNYFVGFRTMRRVASGGQATVQISFDSRDYELAVSSDHGSPVPEVGISPFSWRSSVTCSVEAVVIEGGMNFTCIGWSGTGSVPMSGNESEVVVLLTNLSSSIVWSWVDEDSDQDGLIDDWEMLHFGNLTQAATNDFDLDGQDNYAEFIAGTQPTNPASLFQLVETFEGDQIILTWPTASNRIYNLYWTDNLQHIGFQPLETNMAFPRNSATTTVAGLRGFFKADVSNP